MTFHGRHQSSLESVLKHPQPAPLTPDQEREAELTFSRIVEYCEPIQKLRPYKKVMLVRVTHELCRSRTTFLKHFFAFLGAGIDIHAFTTGLDQFSGFDSSSSEEQKKHAVSGMEKYASFIFENMLLPLRAAGTMRPRPISAALSSGLSDAVDTRSRRILSDATV
ncbi:hypothetical protein H109_01736 [Trichophyton interdigitale MR816]|uniref:Uncharacterized protein n=1 Tax=Trichophyton interdigitale (strain MR816) TaxID=1215338 RepID=A0A059JFA0_TRIIM|nr:hypothetical protein H101_04913 [Trichophyton interdigitale H6]KDB26474.1 hypothetical protein H109_01736 [Trichophyton interdigitale MR816]